MTTTVVPLCSTYTRNKNDKLSQPPIAVTATIGLSPTTIAITVSSCTPRSSAVLPVIQFNCAFVSIFLNQPHESIFASSASLSKGPLFRVLFTIPSLPSWNSQNQC
ncbi:hypothetical protein NX059_012450 [Plenodomus lindquistii]|nr:hypothetical protein NX059_012450 [Plenodomus lindquistii]